MDIVELQHLQATQKEMLRVYSQLCDKYGIQYFAMYGTLLGTVRHQGTIPWDCDIDVVMYSAEYEKFLKVSRELPKQYELRTIVYGDPNLTGLTRIIKKKTRIYVPGHETEKGEIHIDIFVFDYAKQYIPVVKRIVSSVAKFFQIAKLDQYEKQWLYERFASQKSKLFAVHLGEIIRKLAGSSKLERCVYSMLTSQVPTNELITMEEADKRFPTECFNASVLMPYEDLMISVPKEYERILSMEYGAYMEFPPEDERFTADMKKWMIDFDLPNE